MSAASALESRLIRRIALQGPISIAEYMAIALTDPRGGYYMSGDPFGRRGDFTTAPEISQMFGELIGLWCVDFWERGLAAPRSFHWVELGPGRGTLMADALRAAKLVPGFLAAAQIHLVEISPALRALQRDRLAGRSVQWHADPMGLPEEGPLLVVANEFFDALPIRQFLRDEQGWCERLVGLDESGRHLAFRLSAPGVAAAQLVPRSLRDAPPGSLVEVSPAALAVMDGLARRFCRQGGALLALDYGPPESRCGSSLQALRRHARHDPLLDPGQADLTAHVDFVLLVQAAREAGAETYGPIEQGAFLEALGIAERAARLAGTASPGQAAAIEAARARLVEPEQMGRLFKVLAVTAPGLPPPAGFGA
jgi:NADH dehydrogenase [ubiquinone] 1 alpha subcomplex assembly factor 7